MLHRRFILIACGIALATSCQAIGQSRLHPDAGVPFHPKIFDKKWGVHDVATNDWKIQPIFDEVAPFSEGLAAFRIGDKYGYVNAAGIQTIKARFDAAGPFSEGLAAVRLGKKYGYVDKTGKLAIDVRFDDALPFSEHRAAVKTMGKYGYIDPSGEMVIASQFDAAYRFSQGMAGVRKEKHCGFIGLKGETKVAFRFSGVGNFEAGLAPAKVDGKYGYINSSGAFAIEPKFEHAMPFSGGFLAAVSISGKQGYINRKGDFAFDGRFDVAEPFVGGMAHAWSNGKLTVLRAKMDFGKDEPTIAAEASQANVRLVEFASIPGNAVIYLIRKWDWDLKTEDNRESLLTFDRILPDGPTNIKAPVAKGHIWYVAFVLGNDRVYRRLDPDITNQVKVNIP